MTTAVEITERLRLAGCVFPEREASLISQAFASAAERDEAVARRETGVPLEYVVGTAVFGDVTIAIGPPAFIPRARAVTLVDSADRLVDSADRLAGTEPGSRWTVLDLGCGAGPIAAALRRRHPQWEVHACDHDTGALAWARRNGATFGFAVHEGDWFDALPRALEGKLDLVVAHLPYVPTTAVRLLPRDFRDHEPRHTVDGGADGLDPFRVVAAGCRRWLAADGVLLTLVGQEQAATVLAFAADHRLGVELAPADEATGDSVVVSLRRSTGKPA